MGFFSRSKHTDTEENVPVLVVSITNPVSSEIYQDILKQNGIPCICRQSGANGYFKILCGAGIVPDDIYVNKSDFEKAYDLYEAFIKPELESKSDDFEQ